MLDLSKFLCKRCGKLDPTQENLPSGICYVCDSEIHNEKFRTALDSISTDIGNKQVYALDVQIEDYETPIFKENYILIKVDDNIRKHLGNLLDIILREEKELIIGGCKYLLATNVFLDHERVACHLHNKFSNSCGFSRPVILGLKTVYCDWSFRFTPQSNVLSITIEAIEEALIFQHDKKMIRNDADFKFILKQLEEAGDGCLFRGISSHYFKDDGIAASIYRNNEDLAEDGALQDHEREIVERLIDKGFYKSSNQPEISALTDLRHRGKDTCILDFSEDFRIALFFSCQPSDTSEVGEVLVLNKFEYEQKEDITYPNQEDFLVEPTITKTTEERVNAQKSIFLYCHRGYAPRNMTQNKIRNLLIAHPLKSLFYDRCEYTDEAVYPDVHAFMENPENFKTKAKTESLEKREKIQTYPSNANDQK